MPDNMDVFEQEERCRKAIKSVGKAILMRIAIAVLMVFAAAQAPNNGWVWGLMAFVLIITLSALLPLGKELGKQRKLLKTLIESEE